MRFRTMLLIFVGSILFTMLGAAQPRMGDRGGREEAQMKRLKEKVGLTDDQMVKVKEILKKVREETRADFEKSDGDREARRIAMMKRTEKSDAEIMKLLSKEQKIKYEEFKKERQREMEERRRERQ